MDNLTLLGLAKAGGRLIIDAKMHDNLTVQGVIKSAVAAGGHITLRNAKYLDNLTLLGHVKIGGGNLTVDLT